MYTDKYNGDINYVAQVGVFEPSKHYLHSTWRMMNIRCLDNRHKAYPRYGGRGITVCTDWRWDNPNGLSSFIRDIGDRPENHTLERINNEEGYSFSNCKWASKREQQNNLSTSVANLSGVQGVSVYQNSFVVQITLCGTNHVVGIYSLNDLKSAEDRYNLLKSVKMSQGDEAAIAMSKTLDNRSPTNKRLRLGKTSRFYGVSWSKSKKYWRGMTSYRVAPTSKLINKFLGNFDDEVEARDAVLDFLEWLKASGFHKKGITIN